jgi:glutamate synthase domain-containing protein 2
VIGHLRYWFEQLGEYFRQYFFANDREEMPFNRATRAWVYRLAKDEGGTIGFGSTYDLHAPGALIFVNAPFPVLESERLPTPPMAIGEGFCRTPFIARSIVNISGMSFGAISEPAVRALSRGAKEAGCWLDTGEGGLSPFHLEGGCDVIMQIGTAKYGVRDANGNLDFAKLREIAAHDSVRAFEIKLSQGAKPGKGGVLPGAKVTPLIASIRGIPAGKDSISPNRHLDIADMDQLLEKVAQVRDLTGKPVGIKTAIGGRWFANDLAERVLARGLVVDEKYVRVASYAMNMNKEIDMIAHSCGVRHARELRRRHVRLVQPAGDSIALDVMYPHLAPGTPRATGSMPQATAPAAVAPIAHG